MSHEPPDEGFVLLHKAGECLLVSGLGGLHQAPLAHPLTRPFTLIDNTAT